MDFVKDKLNTQEGQEFVKNAEQKFSSGNSSSDKPSQGSDKPSGGSDKPTQSSDKPSGGDSSTQHKYGQYVDKGAEYIEKNVLHKDKLSDSEKQYEAKAKDFINNQLDGFSK